MTIKRVSKQQIGGLFVAACALLSPSLQANAEELLIEQKSGDVIWQMDRGDIVGQSFTSTLTGHISQIGLECNGATVDLEIREGEGASGKLLYSERKVMFRNSYRNHIMHKLTKQVPVEQGKKYTLIVKNQDEWGMRGFFSSRRDEYAGGKRFAIKTSYKEKYNLDLSFVIKGEGVNTGIPIVGKARDITVDAAGNMYAVGSQKGRNGYALYKWAKNAPTWKKMGGEGTRVAAIPGQAWILNDKGQVFQEAGNSWKLVKAPAAQDIGAGGTDVWIAAKDGNVYRNFLGNWVHIKGIMASKIDVDDAGVPWILSPDGKLAYVLNDRAHFIKSHGLKDVAASRPGFAQVVDDRGNITEYSVKTRRWTSVSSNEDAVGVGAGLGQVLRLTNDLDIYRMR